MTRRCARVSVYKHADLRDIDLRITDSGLPVDQKAALGAAGLSIEHA
jgi:hypothetical protein